MKLIKRSFETKWSPVVDRQVQSCPATPIPSGAVLKAVVCDSKFINKDFCAETDLEVQLSDLMVL